MPSLLDKILGLFRAKTPVPTPMRTDAIAMLPVRAREDAFFSATVENARLLQAMHERVAAEIALVEHGGSTMSQGKFVSDMRKILGVDGPGRDDIEDIASVQRLKLIHDFQVQKTFQHANWVRHTQSDAARDAFPALELVREADREKPRDWGRRWAEAGGQFYGGRMIARVDDPVWERISRFGTPYPPFDFNSGMGTREIDREEAESLGVIAPGQQVGVPEDPAEKEVSATASGVGAEGEKFLKSLYGPALEIRDGNIWLPRDIIAGQVAAHDARRAANGASNMSQKGPVDWVASKHPRDPKSGKFISADGSGAEFFSDDDANFWRRNVAKAWNDVERTGRSQERFLHIKGMGDVVLHLGRRGDPNNAFGDGYGQAHISAKHAETRAQQIADVIIFGKNHPTSQYVDATGKKMGVLSAGKPVPTGWIPDPDKVERHYQGRRIIFQREGTQNRLRPLGQQKRKHSKWSITTAYLDAD